MGYAITPERDGAGRVRGRLSSSKTELNRKILDHLLHDAFSDDAADRARESTWCSIPIRRPSGVAEVLGALSVSRRRSWPIRT